jgi:hypothetical protein
MKVAVTVTQPDRLPVDVAFTLPLTELEELVQRIRDAEPKYYIPLNNFLDACEQACRKARETVFGFGDAEAEVDL